MIDFLWALLWNFYIGCAEETMFRMGLMDYVLERKFGFNEKVSLVLSSIVFGAAHLINGQWPFSIHQACEALAMGAVLAFIYKRKGLWPAIFAHAGYDFLVRFLVPVLAGHTPSA